ncbi:MAG: mechanosensitive ion channel domain-containing protein [Phycisphaerales bacterium]
MRRRESIFVIAYASLLLIALMGFAGAAHGQQDPPSAPEAPAQNQQPTADPAEELGALIQTRIAALNEAGPLSPLQRSELEQLNAALAHLERVRTERVGIESFTQAIRTVNEQIDKIDAELTVPIEQAIPQIDVSVDVPTLESDLTQARSQLQTLTSQRNAVDNEESARQARRAAIPNERAAAASRLEEVQSALAAPSDPETPLSTAETRRLLLQAEQLAVQSTMNRLDQELRSYDARKPLLSKRKELGDRRIEIQNRTIAEIEAGINIKTAEEAEADLMRAERESRLAANAHPVVKAIRDETVAIYKQRVAITEDIRRDTASRLTVQESHTKWQAAYEKSKSQVERAGLNDAIGLHLRNQQGRLPDPRTIERRIATIQDKMEAVQLALIERDNQLDELNNPDEVVRSRFLQYARTAGSETATVTDRVRERTRTALKDQAEAIRLLNATYEAYYDRTLFNYQIAQRALLHTVQSYHGFIKQRVLWIQSTDPLSLADGKRTGNAILWLGRPAFWQELGQRLFSYIQTNWLVVGGAVIGLVVLGITRPRMLEQLEVIRKQTSKITTDRFSLTMRAAAITVVVAMFTPALLAIPGWMVRSTGGSELATAVSAGLLRAAELALALALLYRLCRPVNGLAEAHFKWPTASLKLVRRHIRWFTPIVLATACIVAMADVVPEHRNSLGRLAFIAAMIATSIFVHRVCNPNTGVLKGVIARRKGGWIERLRYIWFPAFFLAPVALAIAAAFGYFYTALQLERRIVDTAYLLLIAIVLNAFLMRWLFVVQRRLAIEQARKRAAAAAKARADERAAAEVAARKEAEGKPEGKTIAKTVATSLPAPESAVNLENLDIDVAAVSAQTRKLISTLLAFAVAIGLFLVWAEVLPAFGILNEVELWDTGQAIAHLDGAPDSQGGPLEMFSSNGSNGSDTAGEGVTAASSSTTTTTTATDSQQSRSSSRDGSITLADLLRSTLILVVTIIISRNIPGLLEIAVLQRLPITAGARYAISTIVRYLLVIIGTVMAFNAIGIGWAKVQWLAAAITVGLGFGLQEIFANFVSGLIILIERPIRVGDTVTVGNTIGDVTQIRMRATTITDWDRKELIIPNKEFVTGQVINWTLTDSTVRVKVPVGIAYGSDVELARAQLLDAADQCDLVLDEPKPAALFLGFGTSSLDFELRVFIPTIKYFVPVRDRLHSMIDANFRKSKIEIAFPQQDIHIRTSNVEFPIRHLDAPESE